MTSRPAAKEAEATDAAQIHRSSKASSRGSRTQSENMEKIAATEKKAKELAEQSMFAGPGDDHGQKRFQIRARES